jgi:hypothetical protein
MEWSNTWMKVKNPIEVLNLQKLQVILEVL